MNLIFHQNQTKRTPLVIWMIVILALVLTACKGNANQEGNSTQTAEAALALVGTEMSLTAAVEPTATQTSEPTITPIPTAIPPTPTAVLPVSAATALPVGGTVISADNAAEVKALALYGNGTIEEMVISPDGRWSIVATISGISVYDNTNPDSVKVLLANQSIRSVDISSSGEMIAAGLQDGRVVILNLADGLILREIEAHQSPVLSVEIAPNEMFVASGGEEGLVKVWNLTSGASTGEFDYHIGRINDLAFSPDSKTLASGSSDLLVILWNVETGEKKATLRGQTGSITALAYTDSGQYLASASADTSTYIWDVSVEEPFAYVIPNDDIVRGIAFSPDYKQIAIGGDDNGVDIWEVFDAEGTYQGYLSATINHSYVVKTLAFASNTSLVTGTWGSLLSWWQLPERELVKSIDRGLLITAGFINEHPFIVSEPTPGDVQLSYADTGEEIVYIEKAHTNSVYNAILIDEGQTLITVSYDGFRLWNTETAEMIAEFVDNASFISTLELSKDGKMLGIGWGNGTIDLFDLATQTIISSIEHGSGRVLTLSFSPDGSLLASSGDDETIRIWRLTDGEELLTLTGHGDVVYDVEFSPNGETLASASSDYSVRLWQMVSGEEADWGKQLDIFDDHDFRVKGVAFSPAGDVLASLSDDGYAMLWNLSGGEQLASLIAVTGYAKDIHFNTDGTYIYTWDWDGVMRVFGLYP